MNAIRTAGVVVAAGLLVGCAQKKQPPQAAAPAQQPIQASEQLRQSLVRANPNARVGIVAATVGRFAAVRDVPAGAVAEDATVQILDASGEVIGYGMVRAVKNDTIHVLYQPDTRRGPQVGDLVMPATDAGAPVDVMPAGAPMQPEPRQAAEPSRLPPRRTEAPAETPADAQAPAARDAAAPQPPAAHPQQPAPSLKEETQPGDFKPAQPATDKAALPPVEGGTAPQPAPAPGDAAPQKSPGDTNGAAPAAGDKADQAPQGKAADAPQDKAGDAPAGKAADAPQGGATDGGAAADKKAGDQPSLNK